jgi:hypothetical protein
LNEDTVFIILFILVCRPFLFSSLFSPAVQSLLSSGRLGDFTDPYRTWHDVDPMVWLSRESLLKGNKGLAQEPVKETQSRNIPAGKSFRASA